MKGNEVIHDQGSCPVFPCDQFTETLIQLGLVKAERDALREAVGVARSRLYRIPTFTMRSDQTKLLDDAIDILERALLPVPEKGGEE